MTENPHLRNLIEKVTSDFSSTMGDEKIPLNILLKGHLFIENLLEEILATFDTKKGNLSRRSFYEKTRYLSEIKTEHKLEEYISDVVPILFALNEARNNLAHNLHFQINEGAVNKIGILLGSKFILKKYEVGHDKVSVNLHFCLNEIIKELGQIMFIKLELIKRSTNSERETGSEKPTDKAIEKPLTKLPH